MGLRRFRGTAVQPSDRGSGRDWFSTVTHARLRASQGDVDGARGVLNRILAADPARDDVRRLLADLGRPAPSNATPEVPGPQPRPEPRRSAAAAELAARFRAVARARPADRRVVRLKRLLEACERVRVVPGADADV